MSEARNQFKGHPSIGAGHAMVVLCIAAVIVLCVILAAWFSFLFYVGVLP